MSDEDQKDQQRLPLTPAECDISDWPGIMIDIARLQKSRAWLYCKTKAHLNLAFHLFNLWMTAWHEVPAGSLENDDDVLADKAKCRDVEHWLSIKDEVLRGFVLCSDGRWYHDVIAAKALECWLQKLGARISSGHGNAAKHGTQFDDAHLRAQLDAARESLKALDPNSAYFTKRHGAAHAKPAKAKAKPKAKAGAKTPTKPLPTGDGQDPGGVATEGKKREVKGNEQVGGKPPTTPGADAPSGGAGSGQGESLLELPDWMPKAEWEAFVEMRRKMGKSIPFTLAAAKGIVKKLGELRAVGQDPAAMLEASTRNGWRDVFVIKSPMIPTNSGPQGGHQGGRYAGAANAVFGRQQDAGVVIDA